ncbi:MAG TPA: bifunctional phosphopantothenoylcysteine decarboxylase/phosphopantothenate--cysteine ligase CoaBC [Pricia sp.]|nr:bifunctional phosphopantothenoylcysteine decarboxylase/phosphopantothenate--cysteine ligase CoaBC [Pricia sp.]
MLNGKNILLGITGGIAAYKTTFLVRLLIKAGAVVKIILTESAGNFVSPLTLATLSKNPVLSSFVSEGEGSTDWNNHVELGLWADLLLIAPATAHTLSKKANGTCDNLLLAAYLSAKCPVFFAPAMDLDMYRHPSSKASFKKLQAYGNVMIPATSGELASGLHGEGRMAEPEVIVAFVRDYLSKGLALSGKNVLITGGPTHEAIDPVRFIGNHASGRMGFELARTAADLGAKVVLISGPSHFDTAHESITLERVVSAENMYQAVHRHYPDADIVIAAAAVADYRPKTVAVQKIKKKGIGGSKEEGGLSGRGIGPSTEEGGPSAEEGGLSQNEDGLSQNEGGLFIELVPTRDILLSLGKQKKHQFLVGFALETENELENAKAKLETKNLDAIVLNSLSDAGAGFGTSTNKITFLDKNSVIIPFELKSKAEVARDIFAEIIHRIDA